MLYGHLHGITLERRDGGMFITLHYIEILREECEQRRARSVALPEIIMFRTPITTTMPIIDAFNQGEASFLRADDQARATRLALFDFMAAQQHDDPRWGIVADDLRRHATQILCVAERR